MPRKRWLNRREMLLFLILIALKWEHGNSQSRQEEKWIGGDVNSCKIKEKNEMKIALIILLVFLFNGCTRCTNHKFKSIATSDTISTPQVFTTNVPLLTSDGTPDSGDI